MVKIDPGDGGDPGVHHTRLVVPAAQTGLDDGPFHPLLQKMGEGHEEEDLLVQNENAMLGLECPDPGKQVMPDADEIPVGYGCSVDLDALAGVV